MAFGRVCLLIYCNLSVDILNKCIDVYINGKGQSEQANG